jgi:hypothetical protein
MASSWIRSAVVACAFAFALTGCGAGAGGEGRGAPSAPETAGVDVTVDDEAFCAQLSQVQGHFALLRVSLATDWSTFTEASDELAAVTPPPQLAEHWKTVTDFYAHIAEIFAGVDFADAEAVSAVIEKEFGPETEEAAQRAEEAVAEIDAYAASACPTDTDDASADLTDACELLVAADLDRVFPTGIPEPDSRSYAPDTMECIWESDAAEVSIMLVPLADFESEYLAESEPLPVGEIDDLEGGDTYKGTIGIGRFDTRGHSVSFTHDTVGGFVSVRHGDTNSRAAEVGTAARLAKALVERL